ncbi:MAG: hypothetical protein CME59_12570 [Halioglobus sp.]|nr:hypothetical protein [Halioglobus sp.]
MSEHFSTLSQRFLRRRTLLKTAGLAGAGALLPRLARAGTPLVGFAALPNALSDTHAVAAGYTARVLIRWGDGLDGSDAPRFPLDARQQETRFGCNNDFIAYTPLEGSRRGLLGVNHEYPVGHLMYPGFNSEKKARAGATAAQAALEMAAVGHSVLEIARRGDSWQPVADSAYARRIDANTPMGLSGPAAGHARMQTPDDPQGTRVRGTLGCCSGGKTPWGTVLIAEENVGDYFTGASDNLLACDDPQDVYRGWARAQTRFDLAAQPNELNRFGWVVEYDPVDPASAPVKHTALGRFEHEGATVVYREGAPLVVYSGDDSENQFVYRYVSEGVYEPDRGARNSELLRRGTLYCARFADDGSGRWLPLVHGSGPLHEKNGFASQADVVIDARRAAALLGATPMDRPEGIAVSPRSARACIALTKNKDKAGANGANPRRRNAAGHILEITAPGGAAAARHWEDTFTWDLLLQAGDPDGPGEGRGVYGGAVPAGAWLANPDNLVFDPRGRLWIATDGMQDFGAADGLWCAPATGGSRALPHRFLRCPRGAELCGPEFTPDGQTLFVAIQHPAKEAGSHFDRPSTRWPDFDEHLPPRSAVLAITRDGGGLIGD